LFGSAAGGRQNAATAETATADARKRLQGTYDVAKAELDALKPSRAVGELEALIAGAKPVCREVQDFKSRRTECSPPASLVAELGRAKRRAELEGKVERASAELASIQPARVANSDAKALTRYLSAFGLEVSPDRLNDLLVLLAVVTIETGGGLALAIGMALGTTPGSPPAASETLGVQTGPKTEMPAVDAPVDSPSVQASRQSTTVVHVTADQDLAAWLRLKGGRVSTSMRRLAQELGRSPAGVHIEIGRLAAAGVLTAAPSSRGTVLTLMDAGRLN
jgi:hypothetical protein